MCLFFALEVFIGIFRIFLHRFSSLSNFSFIWTSAITTSSITSPSYPFIVSLSSSLFSFFSLSPSCPLPFISLFVCLSIYLSFLFPHSSFFLLLPILYKVTKKVKQPKSNTYGKRQAIHHSSPWSASLTIPSTYSWKNSWNGCGLILTDITLCSGRSWSQPRPGTNVWIVVRMWLPSSLIVSLFDRLFVCMFVCSFVCFFCLSTVCLFAVCLFVCLFVLILSTV